MISITKLFEFEAAHVLPGHPGKCKQLHGHSYKLEIEVSRVGAEVNDSMMVCDFSDLKKAVQPIIDQMDHTYLNDSLGLSVPTAESMLLFIRDRAKWPKNTMPVRIRIWETSTSYAEWKAVLK